MALGEGVIDTAVDGIIGAYKLLVEPVGRLGLLFKDWNLRGFGFISEEEWQKRESQYCEYANGLTSGISDTLLNVFNFKDLEENTILSPFAYCYNHFGEYISSDASYEDMVGYSKNVVSSIVTVAPLAGKAATSFKPKMKKLKSARVNSNAPVSKVVTPSIKVGGKSSKLPHSLATHALAGKATTSLKPKMKKLKSARVISNAPASKTLTRSIKGAGKTIERSAIEHSSIGDFTRNPKTGEIQKMKGGGHGQANIDFLEQNGIEYNIEYIYSNGVRVGNVPEHKVKAKRICREFG